MQLNPNHIYLDASAPFAEGPLDASICIIGEAPGITEAMKGGAFIGQAGDLLTSCLSSARINRAACRLENVFQFHPRDNSLTPYISFDTKGRAKETPIYVAQRDALAQRLAACSANVFVPLGNIAMYALTGVHGITKYRGSILPSSLLEGRKCLPSIHPSASLKFGAKAKENFLETQRKKGIEPYVYRYWLIHDLSLTNIQSKFPDIRLRERNLQLHPSMADALGYIQSARSCSQIAFDIECTRGVEAQVTHISIAMSANDCMCIPFVTENHDYWTPDQEAELWVELTKLLEDPAVMKLTQNGAFDSGFLFRRYGIIVSPMEDTMIATSILYPDYPAGLDFLVSMYCNGEPYYKNEGKQWRVNPFGNEDAFRRYNAMDSAVLHEIFPKQLKELITFDNIATYHNQAALIPPLVYASSRGVAINITDLDTARAAGRKEVAELEKEWKSACRTEVNPRSDPEVMAYFYGTLGHRPYLNKGIVTCDAKALASLKAKGVDEAGVLLAFRKASKMLNTYFEMSFDTDQRLRCSYNPVGTVQGRISSSQSIFGTGANVQNLPKPMLKVLIPDDGYIMISQDLSQAENRIVAYTFEEYRLMEAFEKGIDVHSLTGALLAGVPLEAVTPAIRQEGKRADHGLNYDEGYQTFARTHQISFTEAKRVVDKYHQIYPGIRVGHARIRDTLSRNNNTLVNCYGRKRRFMTKWGHELFKAAYNFIPQSTVADKINNDGIRYLYERQDLFPEVEFLNQIHDSLWYQIPIAAGAARIVEVVVAIKRRLELPITWGSREFSIPVDTKLGFSLDEFTMLEWKAKHINETPAEALAEEVEHLCRSKGDAQKG